ncbi:juvenile hormone esterase-like [Diabrotica undecimpunctata]|uniref:juvenile hormone esterase-like n=1 Tax=Diabrotica undecimpunctata TaxID=50387 RepID=UPI003B637504
MKFAVVKSLFCVFLTVQASADDGTVVQTESGMIRGHILKSENGNNYYAFQEIPYAAPPIGENRFQNPKIPNAWPGMLDTTKNTKVCYQTVVKYSNLKISEDCLYVNVYTPQKPGSADLLPVLLWIHGGAFQNESSTYEYYGPKYIMDHGVVVVTFNYRLGPFGFVGTQDGVVPLNLGLKDQRFAIEWVNRNIHLFGGNPEHMVLVGESAGSRSVGYHLMGPWEGEKQLFHGVIMQSASPISGGRTQDLGTTTETALELGRRVDPSFDSNDTKQLLQVLQNADAKDIIYSGIPGGIAIEDSGPFSYPGFQAFLDGNYKKVPVLIGFNSEEWGFIAFETSEQTLEELDLNPSNLVVNGLNTSPENRPVAGELLKDVYTHNTSFAGNMGYFVRYSSDIMFTTSTCKQVELASKVVPYYFYQFSYKGYLGQAMDMVPKLPPGCEKVVHSEDLHYMWDDGNNSDLSKFPEEDRLMLHQYVVMWTNFVKYFNPTPVQDPLLNNFIWLPSEPISLRYMNINTTFEMLEQPRQYPQVKQILEKYMEPPYNIFS